MDSGKDVNTNSIFYTDEDISRRLRTENIEIDKLSLSDLLASERTDLANKRNIYALKRTFQAAERTYSAWLRTGFSIVSAGIAISGLIESPGIFTLSNLIGFMLILTGVSTFIYAWYGYYRTYKFLKNTSTPEQMNGVPRRTELITISFITFILLSTSVAAFVIILFV